MKKVRLNYIRGKPLIYKETDFSVRQNHDARIAYTFESKDGNVLANFFFTPGDVQMRAMVGDTGILQVGFPFANPKGGGNTLPGPGKILRVLIDMLKRGEYRE